jgi:hypothetical protein
MIVVAIVAALLFHWFRPKPVQAACVVGVDVRGSSTLNIEQYRQWLPGILDSCALSTRARVSVVPITSRTVTGVTPAVRINLAETPDLSGDPTNDKARVKDALVGFIADEVPSVFDTAAQDGGGTDLLGFAEVALPELANAAPGSTLVMTSDGIHNQEPYRLQHIDLDQASIDRYVAELRDAGRIPDLRGVDVYMYGVGVGNTTSGADADLLQGVERFWRAYWSASGANLRAYQKQP